MQPKGGGKYEYVQNLQKRNKRQKNLLFKQL